jgi:hypothetical protein
MDHSVTHNRIEGTCTIVDAGPNERARCASTALDHRRMFSGSGSTRHCVASNAPSERARCDVLLRQIVLNKIDTDAASLFRALCECVLSNHPFERISCGIDHIGTPSVPSRERVRCANANCDSQRISSNKLNTAVHQGDCIAICAASTTFHQKKNATQFFVVAFSRLRTNKIIHFPSQSSNHA